MATCHRRISVRQLTFLNRLDVLALVKYECVGAAAAAEDEAEAEAAAAAAPTSSDAASPTLAAEACSRRTALSSFMPSSLHAPSAARAASSSSA